jgi:hypothetical protein
VVINDQSCGQLPERGCQIGMGSLLIRMFLALTVGAAFPSLTA